MGTVDEDFAIDSSAGDVFLLGTTSWRIHAPGAERGVGRGRARARRRRVPFWFGEAPARTRELSDEVGELREAIADRLRSRAATAGDRVARRRRAPLDARGRAPAPRLRGRGAAALGAVPSQTHRGRRALLRRGRGHAARASTRRSARASTGRGAWRCASASAARFDFELQAVGHRRRRAVLAGPAALVPARGRSSSWSTPTSLRRGADAGGASRRRCSARASGGTRRARWRCCAPAAGKKVPPLQDAHGLRRPARGRVPRAGGLPGQPRRRADRAARSPAGERDAARLPDRADGRRRPRRRAAQAARRARSLRAPRETPEPTRALARDPQRQPLCLPRRRAAGGAARARGVGAARAARRRSRTASARSMRARSATVVREAAAPTCATPTRCTSCSATWCWCPKAFLRRGVPLAEGRGCAARGRPRSARRISRAPAGPCGVRGAWCATERRAHVEAIWPGATFEPDARAAVECPAEAAARGRARRSASGRGWRSFGPTTSADAGRVAGQSEPQDVTISVGAHRAWQRHARSLHRATRRRSKRVERLAPAGLDEVEWCDRGAARPHPPPHRRRPAARRRAGPAGRI